MDMSDGGAVKRRSTFTVLMTTDSSVLENASEHNRRFGTKKSTGK
jgi:hypothetical protein